MNIEKAVIKTPIEYIRVFLKWVVLSVIVGIIGGAVGSVFHESIEYVTKLRTENSWLIFLLPFGGLVIAFFYWLFRKKGRIDTNRVIEAARADEKVPVVMMPLIFVSTVITHLLGGSAGREGAALQLGGSLGYSIGKLFRLSNKDLHIIVMSGMSGVFSALFGTPLAAAFFSLEVISVGVIHYAAMIPCLISSIAAYMFSKAAFGVEYTYFKDIFVQMPAPDLMLKVIVLAVLCALLSIVFCLAIKKSEFYMKKFIPNSFLRAFAGGTAIVLLTFALQTTDYNGAGMNVVSNALILGEARPEAFVLKIVFTAITIAAGFKGGEIVPTFFIGSTFGCVMAPLLGIDPGFGAAVGFVSLFCGMVNCPVASVFLALEMFGSGSILYFAVASGVSFMLSGYFGLYKSQKIVYSKLSEDYIDINTK